MSKVNLVTEILNVYDENERLKNELKEFKLKNKLSIDEGVGESEIEKNIFILGRNYLFGIVYNQYSGYSNMRVDYDDNRNVSVTSYENWIESVVRKDKLLPTISYKDFVEFFETELKEQYEFSKDKSIKNLDE